MCSNSIAIEVTNISKCFHIYESPADRLKQFIFPKIKRIGSRTEPRSYFREFWALDDVSFSIPKGQTIGIIGHNGAGKSTLLQIICGTLTPSSGEVRIDGRIAALLELGAGFNPEFSGKDNVYLNGSVLGLSKEEIDDKFDEIANFADIGEFIYQPVKTYSSGMYVRLAFAVQACIEPEILIVDEALAVGDIGFQYKCFKRMEALKKKGVTIIMVTHSTGSILEYADRCLVMKGGKLIVDTTDVLAAVLAYEKGMILSQSPQASIDELTNDNRGSSTAEVVTQEDLIRKRDSDINLSVGEKRFGTARAIIESLNIMKENGEAFTDKPIIKSGELLTLKFKLTACEEINDVVLGVSLSRTQGGDIWGDNNITAGHPITLLPGTHTISYQVRLPVNSGDYLLHCGLASIKNDIREELDQRRPMMVLKFWAAKELGGVLYAPITISS